MYQAKENSGLDFLVPETPFSKDLGCLNSHHLDGSGGASLANKASFKESETFSSKSKRNATDNFDFRKPSKITRSSTNLKPVKNTNTRIPVLSVNQLTKAYKGGKNVLDNISFELHQGEFVAVIGRSGAGKSTMLHTLNGTITASSGEIIDTTSQGDNVVTMPRKQLRQWRSQCSMIFQNFCLVPRLDVITNVLLGRLSYTSTWKSLFKIFDDSDRVKAIELLKWLKILPHALQRAENLSGGQQQRVAICRALMQEPKILLADEPVASLDPKNTTRIMDALQKVSEQGIAVMVNLHSIELVKQYCTRVIGLENGKVVYDGAPNGLTDEILQTLYGDEVEQLS